MSDSSSINRVIVLLGAGICLALPFIFTSLWWLIIPGIALAIHSIINCGSYIEAVSVGWLLGTAKALGGFYFIWSTFPLTGVAVGNLLLEWLSVGLFWLSTAAFMGVGGVALAVGLYWLSQRKPILIPFAFPFLLILAEVVGSLFASIIFLGPGAFLNIYLAHGYVGIPLAHLDVLYPFVRQAGIYGLVFVAAVLGVLVHRLVFGDTNDRKRMVGATLGVLACIYLLAVAFPATVHIKTGSHYMAIDTYFPTRAVIAKEGLDIDKNKEMTEAVTKAFEYEPDVILLSEDVRLINAFGTDQKTLEFLQSIATSSKPIVVDSSRIDINNNAYAYQRAFYYDLENNQIYKKDKQYLIAQGEYISYLFRGVFLLFGQHELLKSAAQNMNYVAGPIKSYKDFPSNFPAIIFCFESSTGLAAKLLGKEDNLGDVVLHPVSHSNFHSPELFWYQLDALLRTQAIWSAKTIISATNMAQSKAYYPDGRIETGNVLAEAPFWRLVSYEL